MIAIKSTMAEMPSCCNDCDEHFGSVKSGYCASLGCFDGNVTDRTIRLLNCPLVEIGETKEDRADEHLRSGL